MKLLEMVSYDQISYFLSIYLANMAYSVYKRVLFYKLIKTYYLILGTDRVPITCVIVSDSDSLLL